MALLYGYAWRLTVKNGGSRTGQKGAPGIPGKKAAPAIPTKAKSLPTNDSAKDTDEATDTDEDDASGAAPAPKVTTSRAWAETRSARWTTAWTSWSAPLRF